MSSCHVTYGPLETCRDADITRQDTYPITITMYGHCRMQEKTRRSSIPSIDFPSLSTQSTALFLLLLHTIISKWKHLCLHPPPNTIAYVNLYISAHNLALLVAVETLD